MAATRNCLRFALFFVSFALITSSQIRQSTEVDDNEESEELSPASSQQNDVTATGEWTIFEPKDFKRNELCQVLNCRRQELCAVRHNNAICVKKRKLDEIEGAKIYYKSPTSNTETADNNSKDHHEESKIHQIPLNKITIIKEADQNTVDDQEWDHQKFREKMSNHNQKLKNKQKNKAKASMANEVQTDENHSHERHTQKMGSYDQCSEQQLVAIESRLVQWFSDIHAQQPGERNLPLHKHKISCREDVGWFFTQLDGDNNGKLSVDELNSLDHDPYEKCIKPFLDRCDINADDLVSVNEWCDCFQWSGQEREEPPCHSARRKHDPHLLGSFSPRCDVEGYYRPEQCHESSCWCVDKWGREFDKSRSKGRPDCGQYAEVDNEEDDDD